MNATEPQPAIAVALLPVGAICASPSNPRRRIDDAYIAELADSIKAHGLIQPITLRPNPRGNTLYEIVVGECRWRAARRAGLAMIPAFWRELDDKQVLEIQVIETAIQAAISRPMAYPEIENAVGKQRNPFALGIALTKMVLDGRLHYAFPDTFSAKWPVYSNKPIPKKFQHPKRDALPLNVPHEGADAASSRTLPLDVVVGARAQTEE